MPAKIRTIIRTAVLGATLGAALVSFSGDALAISEACKGKPRPDRTAANAFFKGFMPRYTMGECMVRLKLDVHDGVRETSAIYQVGKEFSRYLYTHKPSAAAYYFEPGRDGYHYLMFANECPSRYAITAGMIEAVQPCFAGEVDIKMIQGPVTPSAQTFVPTTTEWTDSNPE